MSELADELARHARPEHVKELAAEKVSEWKERAKELASEKASEIKTHAKEAVMQRTMDVKERVDTPRGWSLLGAILGAGVGAVLMKKAFSVREERSIDVGRDEFRYRGERYSQSVKDKAHDLKDRAMGAVDQVRDQTQHLRERIPSGTELKGRATHWFDRALESQPLMLALGSAALGVFASLIIPVSGRERQLIEPAKRKAQESISQLGDQIEQKIQGQEAARGGSYQERMGTLGSSEGLMAAERPSPDGSDRSDTLASPTGSRIPPLPPLDDVSTKIH